MMFWYASTLSIALRLACRMREEEERIQGEEKKEAEKRKKLRQEKKDWHASSGNRVNSWRDWSKSVRGQAFAESSVSTVADVYISTADEVPRRLTSCPLMDEFKSTIYGPTCMSG
jgi:hypothetical protein